MNRYTILIVVLIPLVVVSGLYGLVLYDKDRLGKSMGMEFTIDGFSAYQNGRYCVWRFVAPRSTYHIMVINYGFYPFRDYGLKFEFLE